MKTIRTIFIRKVIQTALLVFVGIVGLTGCKSNQNIADQATSDAGTFEKHTMSPGLVMAGYQGWFNAPGDGADRGWYHYTRQGRFEPGFCTIDMWPDMTEYEVQYETPFQYADGSYAKTFSSHDESTVRLHFKWMEEYGIDGVFMQRFVGEVKRESGRNHFNKVLRSATRAALDYDRTIAVMYDLSGMRSGDEDVLIEDWKALLATHKFDQRSAYSNYLFNEGKPLVAVWGVGFNDNRKYNLDDIEKIIRFLKSDEGGNCSVLLGVPTYWREQGNDCIKDERLHEVIQMADVVHPWFVGRFDESRYDAFKPLIGKDKEWCDEHGLKYIPVAFPGFSWFNMYPESTSSIDRNQGNFLWKQLSGASSEGAEMIYVAMFDEIDEATAIFKLAKEVPVGESTFVPLDEDIPSDHYLWLTGTAAQMMKNRQPLPVEKPVQNFAPVSNPGDPEDITSYIDPTIGNVSRFLVPTYPTFHLPNQMVRMVPEKSDYLSDEVQAWPLQVAAHRNKGLFRMKVVHGEVTAESWREKMVIDHDLEIVHPWHYSTYLIEEDIRVSFTPGAKCGIYKIEFPDVSNRNLLVSGSGQMDIEENGDGSISLRDKIVYTTRGIFSETREMDVFIHAVLTDASGTQTGDLALDASTGRLALRIPSDAANPVLLKYAISYISKEQAKYNYAQELDQVNFDALAEQGKETWEQTAGQIRVEGGTLAQKRTFYTSLYRNYERMVDINEYGQYFSGYDGKVHQSDRPFYVDDWIWDTYLAAHPLRTILDPEMENDMLHSYVQMYEQSGWMPTFPQVHGNHMCMNAYHSSAIFIDGYRKGLKDYDVEKAYEGIKKNLVEGTFIPWRQGTPRRPIDDFYHEQGYFPSLRPGEEETEPQMDGFEKRQPVAVTLGIAYDFWTLSELAGELGKKEEEAQFAARAKDYQNLWHPGHRLFMPKDDQGEWIDIDPKKDGGPGYRDYYDENNGWTYAWDVQHDIGGLVDLLGGRKAAEERLDQLFREPLGMRKREFYVHGSNSTGMVGQFSMGNEPSFHIPYLFNYFGAPWKTQQKTRFLLDVWFKDNIFGIPGDEDGGGMTAFVVFSSMGIYPVTPGLPVYTITSPVFEKVSVQLTNGNTFTVVADGASKTKKYIQRAFINGEEIFSPFITHEQVMAGATLELELGELPDKEWGKEPVMPEI